MLFKKDFGISIAAVPNKIADTIIPDIMKKDTQWEHHLHIGKESLLPSALPVLVTANVVGPHHHPHHHRRHLLR